MSKYFEPFIFENLPAKDRIPNKAYIKEVEQSDIYIALIGKDYGLPEPEFKMQAGFVAIIYRKKGLALSRVRNRKDTVKDTVKLTSIQKNILKEISVNQFITIQEISEKVKINIRNTKSNISKLKDKGLLERVGSDKNGYWRVI